MKLHSIFAVGRYVNPETGKPVNVKKGKKEGRSISYHFFLRSGVRVFIDEADFRNKWVKVPEPNIL